MSAHMPKFQLTQQESKVFNPKELPIQPPISIHVEQKVEFLVFPPGIWQGDGRSYKVKRQNAAGGREGRWEGGGEV